MELFSTIFVIVLICAFTAFGGYVIIAGEHEDARKRKAKRSKSK